MILGQIITPLQEDYEYLQNFLSKYPLRIIRELPENYDVDTKIIGWKFIKQHWPEQNIFNKELHSNVAWTYSVTEDEGNFQQDVQKFVDQCIKKWLPSEFQLRDSFEDKELLGDTLKQFIDSGDKIYLNFHKGALYIYHDGNNYIFNVKSLFLFYEDYKAVLTRFIKKANVVCLSYRNIAPYVYLDEIDYVYTFENVYWIKYSKELTRKFFQIIPNMDVGKYIPFIMSGLDKFTFDEIEERAMKRAAVRDNVTEWLSQRSICFNENLISNGISFIHREKKKFATIDFSNKRTVTGRITATSSYDPQKLEKKTDARKDIISRFQGGKIVVYDYTSFESRIALYLCGNEEYIQEYQFKDLHYEVAKIIFGEQNFITDEDREFSKIINHSILYGASLNSILKKLEATNDPRDIYNNIVIFLKPLLKKSEEIKEFYKVHGYVVTPWGTIVRPNKEFAYFNNFIQSTATEILVEKIIELRKFLYSYKSEMIFQVHDSVVFDIHPDESNLIKNIAKILMKIDNMIFTLDYKSGYNFKELSAPIKIITY